MIQNILLIYAAGFLACCGFGIWLFWFAIGKAWKRVCIMSLIWPLMVLAFVLILIGELSVRAISRAWE